MITKLRQRAEDEKGFTLIELLVVVLIVGILAAIALPMFLGQQAKGEDASAKSDARNLVSQVESCYSTSQDYSQCMTAAQLPNTGLTLGTGKGQVSVTAAATKDATDPYSWTIVAQSESGGAFTIRKTAGVVSRSCSKPGKGACKGATTDTSGSW